MNRADIDDIRVWRKLLLVTLYRCSNTITECGLLVTLSCARTAQALPSRCARPAPAVWRHTNTLNVRNIKMVDDLLLMVQAGVGNAIVLRQL